MPRRWVAGVDRRSNAVYCSRRSGDPAEELDLPKCEVASTYLKYGDSA
jgi:hypothetical protein